MHIIWPYYLKFKFMIMILRKQLFSKSVLTESVNSLIILGDDYTGQESSEMNDGNIEIVKLQEFLATITEEWKGKKGQDIRSLRDTFKQVAQTERARIARIESVLQIDSNKLEFSTCFKCKI